MGDTVREMGMSRPSRPFRIVSKWSTLLPGANRLQHDVLFGLSIVGNDAAYRRADHLGGGESEHALGGLIPRQNVAVQVLTDDRIVGRLHNSGKPPVNVVEPLGHCALRLVDAIRACKMHV